MKKILNKKGLAFQAIIIILVLVIVFVLLIMVFLTPKGLLQKVAEKSKVILTYLPGGDDPAPKTEVEVSLEVENMFNGLVKAFRDNKNKTGPCLIKYGSKLDDLDKNVITFSVLDDKTAIRVLNEQKQVVKIETVSEVKLCVVAGKQGETVIHAQNFYLNYFTGTLSKSFKPDFLKVSGVSITEENIFWSNEESEFEDGSLLYVPEKGRICFFPTTSDLLDWDCEGHQKGLEQDCFDDANDQIYVVLSNNQC